MIVHSKVFVPVVKPVTPEVGDAGVVTVAPPAITVQTPVPDVGVLPDNVAVVTVSHCVWSNPASAIVASASTLIVTSSEDAAQTPFVIVQLNTFAPTPNPVTPEVGEEGVVIVPVPDVNVQIPVPVTGVFPASVAVPGVSQTV